MRIYDRYKNEILERLREGKDPKDIKKDLTCSLTQVYRMIDELIKNGEITRIEIDMARNPNIKIVLEGLREGKAPKDIEKDVTCSLTQVYRIVDKLIEMGEITQDEIDEARDIDMQIVLKGLTEGKSAEEIEKDAKCGRTKVYRLIKKLIESGRITKEEIDIAKKKAEKRILKLFKLGFTEQEISTIMGINKELFECRMQKAISKKQITQEEIDIAYKGRKSAAEKRKMSIIESVYYRREISPEIVEEYIEYTTAKACLERLEYSEAKLLGTVLVKDAKFITPSNVKIMLTLYTRNNEPERAIGFLDECIGVIREDSNTTAILRRAKQEIEANLERIKETSVNKNETQPLVEQGVSRRDIEYLEH